MDTIDRNDAYTVTSLDDIAKIYAKPLPNVATKETDHITEVGRAFIAASPFLVIAASNGTSIDCSPKGDAPGFVQLLDDRTLLIPDRPGNNRIDGMKNLLVNPKVGIIFMVPDQRNVSRDWQRDDQHGPGVVEAIRGRWQGAARGRGRRCRGSLNQCPKASCGRNCGRRRRGRAARRATATSPPPATARMRPTPGIITRNMPSGSRPSFTDQAAKREAATGIRAAVRDYIAARVDELTGSPRRSTTLNSPYVGLK